MAEPFRAKGPHKNVRTQAGQSIKCPGRYLFVVVMGQHRKNFNSVGRRKMSTSRADCHFALERSSSVAKIFDYFRAE